VTFCLFERVGEDDEIVGREWIDAYVVLFGSESQKLLDDPAVLAGAALYLEDGVVDSVAVG